MSPQFPHRRKDDVRLSRDLQLFHVYRLLSTSYLFLPVLITFFVSRGLDFTHIALLNTVSAPTAIVEYDSRDNVFTPTKGIYSETSWLASREALGASTDFERFEQILLAWHPLPHNVTIGARGNYAWSSTGTPFFLRPYIQLRGVPAVRYQGDQAASIEVEARWQFLGRWSAVVFGGAGTTRTEKNTFSATQNVGSGGLGFRYELASKFGLHAGIDVAHSPGTTAVYFVVGNAWFRP